MNFIEDINKLLDKVFLPEGNWKSPKNIGSFYLSLSLAKRIRKRDETGKEDEEIVKDIINLAESHNITVLKERETNGTWEG